MQNNTLTQMSPAAKFEISSPHQLQAVKELSNNTTNLNSTSAKPTGRHFREIPAEPFKGDPLKGAKLFQRPSMDVSEDDFKYI